MNSSALPESIATLCAVIGYDATMALVKSFGGRDLLIPAHAPGYPSAQYELIEAAIGTAAADILCVKHVGRLYVPKCQQALTQARWRKIQMAFDAGKSVGLLVSEFGLSERQIMTILKKTLTTQPAPAAKQYDLFQFESEIT